MRQEQLVALELDRRHIGLLVKVVTDSFSIIGTLERVEQDDDKEWDWEGRPLRRDLRTRLRISGWVGEVNPGQYVTVEWPEPQLPPAGEWQAAGSLTSGAQLFMAPADAPPPVLKPEPEAIPGEVVDGSVWVTGRVVPCGPQLNGNWHCNVAQCSRPADERCPLRMLEELGEGQE